MMNMDMSKRIDNSEVQLINRNTGEVMHTQTLGIGNFVRTEEVKQKCAEKIAEDIAATLCCNLSSVSVTIHEVAQEDWKAKVWDSRITPAGEELYVKPGYTCD